MGAAADPLADVVRQRSQLGRAMQQVELAASAPIGKESWVVDLQQALRQLEIALNHHMVDVQSPEGLFDRVVEEAPRLQRPVEEMRQDHKSLVASVREMLQVTAAAEEGSERYSLRERAVEILVAMARHRQRGADLIFDAYDIDIGGY